MGSGSSIASSASFPVLYRISHRLETKEARSVWTVAVSHSGKILVCATGDFLIRVWSLERFEQVHVIEAHDDAVWSLIFSPDDKLVVSSSADGTVRVLDPRSGEIKHTLRSQSNWVWGTAFSKDGSILACGGTDSCIYTYTMSDYRLLHVQKLHEKSISKLVFSNQDTSRLISASYDGTIAVFDVATNEVVLRLEGHVGGITCLALNPRENHLLASGGEDTTVRLWDLRELKTSAALQSRTSVHGLNFPHHVLHGHKEKLTAVAFNHAAELLVSASRDATVRVWILPAGYRELGGKFNTPPSQLAVIAMHSAWVQSVHWLGRNFSALLSVSTDGTIVVHAVPLQFWKDPDGKQVKICKKELLTDTTWVEPLKYIR